MRKSIFRTTIWSCLSLLAACQTDGLDKIKPGTISPNLALNLGFSEYTVKELLSDLDAESVKDGPNNTLSLYFEDSTVYNNTDEFVAISSVANQEEFAPGQNVPSTPAGYQVVISETFKFSFPANNGEEIDSIYYKSGTLDFEMVSTFKGDVDYTWVIEETSDVETEVNLTQTQQLTYTFGNVTDSYSRPLLGLKSKFYKNAADENEFQVKVTGTITFEAGEEILPSHKMVFDLAYNNPTFTKLYGNFGNDVIELQNQRIELTSFDEFTGDGLKLEDPKILLITENSYGIDMELSFDEVRAISNSGTSIALVEKDPPGIDGFTSSPDVEGEIKVDTVTIDKENSNIDDLLNSLPDAMDFTISAVPNPVGTTRDPNFMLEESQIKVKSQIIIPMQFQMDGYSVDFEFDLDGLDIDGAESLSFNLTSTNEIPFTGTIDLAFEDDQGNTLHEITDAASIESPELDANGVTTEARVSTSGIPLSEEGIDALLDAQKVKVMANISTFEAENDRFVTLYSNYILKIELALAGEVLIEL